MSPCANIEFPSTCSPPPSHEALPVSIIHSSQRTPLKIHIDCNSTLKKPNTPLQINTLPSYLQSFQDTGVSEARLKRFSWLHPKNYSGEGSLSDDYTLSPHGTSVSSPRGDDNWEIVDRGPRKSIDILWEEVFEFQNRIRLIEETHQAQFRARVCTCNKDQANMEQQQQLYHHYHHYKEHEQENMSEIDSSTEPTCTSPSSTVASGSSFSSSSTSITPTCIITSLNQSPSTQIDQTKVFVKDLLIRADHGSALRQLWSVIYSMD